MTVSSSVPDEAMRVMLSPLLLSFPEGFGMSVNPFALMVPASAVTFPDASTRVAPSRESSRFVMFSSSTHSSLPVLGEGRNSEMMMSPGERDGVCGDDVVEDVETVVVGDEMTIGVGVWVAEVTTFVVSVV